MALFASVSFDSEPFCTGSGAGLSYGFELEILDSYPHPFTRHLEGLIDSQGNLKVLLVSLDDKNKLDSRVSPFIMKHQITPEVKLLADQNYTAWTDEIDPSWFGALPATIITNGEKRNFKFGAYESYDDLLHDFNSMKE